MFITPIFGFKGTKVQKNNSSVMYNPALQIQKTDSVSFSGGPDPQVEKNKYKIRLTQDIWEDDKKICVKMPENDMEKEVLLEVLEHRSRLSKYVKLKRDRAELTHELARVANLIQEDSKNPKLPKLVEELKAKGDVVSIINTMDKKIEEQEKRHKVDIAYFAEIDELKEKYIEDKKINYNHLDKFWYSCKNNNLNKNEEFSLKELIEIVKVGKTPKEQLVENITNMFEDVLRSSVDVYQLNPHHYKDSAKAKEKVHESFKESIEKYPDIEKVLVKNFKGIEQKMMATVNKVCSIDIYPIGEIWVDMFKAEDELRAMDKNIVELTQQLQEEPENEELKEKLTSAFEERETQRGEWLKGVQYSLDYEAINKERMRDNKKEKEYDYLTEKSPTLSLHKEVWQAYLENGNQLPEHYWTKILEK